MCISCQACPSADFVLRLSKRAELNGAQIDLNKSMWLINYPLCNFVFKGNYLSSNQLRRTIAYVLYTACWPLSIMYNRLAQQFVIWDVS